MAHPADRDERGHKGKQIQTSPQGQGDVLASYIVVAAFARLCPTSCDAQGDDNQDYGDTHERPGRLQLWWENKKWVIHFALHLDVSLAVAVHPQALPEYFHDNDIGANEGSDPPHGHRSDSYGPKQADEAQDQG